MQNNLVAKHARTFSKSSVQKCKKKELKKQGRKTKHRNKDCFFKIF